MYRRFGPLGRCFGLSLSDGVDAFVRNKRPVRTGSEPVVGSPRCRLCRSGDAAPGRRDNVPQDDPAAAAPCRSGVRSPFRSLSPSGFSAPLSIRGSTRFRRTQRGWRRSAARRGLPHETPCAAVRFRRASLPRAAPSGRPLSKIVPPKMGILGNFSYFCINWKIMNLNAEVV